MKETVKNTWPGEDERAVVEEMLRDPLSHHWEECSKFMQKIIINANLPNHLKEEVVQNTMLSVIGYLPKYRYQSKLTTLLVILARNRIVDMMRAEKRWNVEQTVLLNQDGENELDWQSTLTSQSTEDQCIEHEFLRETLRALADFVQKHSKPTRNMQILQMVLFDGYSYTEAAQKLGISPPVVGYVVRSAQAYLRETMRH